jgi:hypothetical protein
LSLPFSSFRTKRKIHISGQATLEYVLLLFIVTSLIFGTVYQFNDAFRQFASNYFGSYLSCLLETGELPNLGAENSDNLCDADYQPFSLANGRAPRPSSGGDRQSVGDTLRNNDRERTARIDADTGGVASRGGDGASGRSGSVPGGRFDPSFSRGREGAPDRVALNASEKKEIDGVNQAVNRTGPQAAGASSRDTSSSGRIPLNESESKSFGASKGGVLDESDPQGRKGARVPAVSSVKKPVIGDVTEFSIGGWIRIIAIILIVLAIMFFIAGQILQFSKSREKSDGT